MKSIFSLYKAWGNRSGYEFAEQHIPKGKFTYADELRSSMRQAIQKRNESDLETVLNFLSFDGLDRQLTPILCDLLDADWHELHEDIIMMLDDIKDPESIEAVYRAGLNYPDWDDGRSQTKKAIWALTSIGTHAAIEKIKLYALHDDWIIRENADMALKGIKERQSHFE